MADPNDHDACVNTWMERVTSELSPEQLVQVFENAFAALWRRAHQTLGDVTLMAIVDRVLYTAAEQHPIFASTKVEATGLRSQGLRENAASSPPVEVAGAIRFALVELLTVLGNLTADILTPSLHAELSKVGTETGSDRQKRGEDPRPW